MPIDDFELTSKRIKRPFHEAGQNKIYSQLKNRTSSTVEMRRLEIRVTDIRAKVRAHYAKNRDQWVNREIERMTQKRHKPAGDSYQPGGWLGNLGQKATDPDVIRNSANDRIEFRHQRRMGQINEVYDRMVKDIVKRSWKQERSR